MIFLFKNQNLVILNLHLTNALGWWGLGSKINGPEIQEIKLFLILNYLVKTNKILILTIWNESHHNNAFWSNSNLIWLFNDLIWTSQKILPGSVLGPISEKKVFLVMIKLPRESVLWNHYFCQISTGGSCLMLISLVLISLLQFFKTFHKCLPDASLGLFISWAQFFWEENGQKIAPKKQMSPKLAIHKYLANAEFG